MCHPHAMERLEDFGSLSDETLLRIPSAKFEVATPPEAAISEDCEIWSLGHAKGFSSGDELG